MIIAHVIPLRRFPAHHQWFDYLVPAGMTIRPGHLVEVPFLRQQVPGIVWNVTGQSTISRLKSVTTLLRSEPVMTDWQRLLCLAITQQSFVSLGHIVGSIIPDFPCRKTTIKPWVPVTSRLAVQPVQPPPGLTWWYRSRSEAMAWMLWWMKQEDSMTRLIMVPTIEDGLELFNLIRTEVTDLAYVDSHLNKNAYATITEGVRQGKIKHVIGTGRGLTLPYPAVPEVLVDQEEHPAHKQTEQQPRTDYRRILQVVQADVHVTTPGPSVRWWHQHHPAGPTPGRGLRQLIDLGQARRAPWLSGECETWIDRAHTNHQPLLLIAPQHGYASSISCRDCHLTVDCRQCRQRLRLMKRGQNVHCGHCGHDQQLPTTCPRCHGARWTVHGWGVEYVADQIKQIWPKIVVTSAGSPAEPADIVLETYRGYRQARTVKNLRGTVVINGDALLNYPDFTVAERAWQYLARLQAEAPDAAVMVQTFDPTGDFWQRWRRWDDRAWYAAELVIRERHHLPPVSDQWIVRWPEKNPAGTVQKKLTEIKQLALSGISAALLPETDRQTVSDRILLTSTIGTIAAQVDGRQLFPWPWQVDTTVASWLR